jgi:hypothetical protein
MKTGHAAALVLVGWYLMVPPLVNAPYKIDTEAPLASWKLYKKFDSSEDCNKFLSSAQARYKPTATAPSGSIKRGTRAFALQMVFGQCVSSDNPRLKGD